MEKTVNSWIVIIMLIIYLLGLGGIVSMKDYAQHVPDSDFIFGVLAILASIGWSAVVFLISYFLISDPMKKKGKGGKGKGC